MTTLPSTSKSDKDLANDFNTHFINIGIDASKENTTSIECNHEIHANSKFIFSEISVDQVIDELHAISPNKASGLDNVCTKLIKYGSKAVAPILCKIFNMCLKQGCVPDELKVARVSSTRVIQKVLPVGSYLCSGKWYAFKIFYNNTFDLWLQCMKISSVYLLYIFLGAPNTPAGFGAPETDKK